MLIWPTPPRVNRPFVEGLIKSSRPDKNVPDVCLLFVRGYRRDTMGKPGVNDRNIYDDAVFLVSKDTFIAFNCNVDPSAFKAGVATVLPGWYPFKKGNHGISRPGGGYPAFRPATPGEALPVKRDGESTVPSKHPGVATNIHKGGLRTTSSLGCLTIHPKDWATFHAAVVREMDRNKLKTIPVGIIDGPIA